RSFVDVGGLWGTVNEKVTVAAKHHAARLAMLDISPPGSPWWEPFRARLAEADGLECRCISDDICVAASRADLLYDVVHCSGVLYHHPNPVLLLSSLRRITRRHLILTSAVLPESVSNACGSFHLPSSGAVFIPALNSQEREILWL